MPVKQYMQQVHQPVGMGVDVLALLNINLPPYNTPVPGAFYNPWMQHVMGATATLFDLSALLPWGSVHRGRRLLIHLIPAAPVVAGGTMWAWRCSSGSNQTVDFCKADLVPQTHFLLSADLVRNWGTLQLMLSGGACSMLPFDHPHILCWAPALFEVAEGTMLISFAVFIAQCTALSLFTAHHSHWGWRRESSFPSGLKSFLWTLLLFMQALIHFHNAPVR